MRDAQAIRGLLRTGPGRGKTPAVSSPELILASGSPRRAELLTAAGLVFHVQPVALDEQRRPGEAPEDMCRRLAVAKARSVAAAHPRAAVLGADTTVWFDREGDPLGKPRDRTEARRMLGRLTGGEPHFVTTGYALVGPAVAGDTTGDRVGHETTRVFMRRLPAAAIEALLDAGEWSDKAGGYAIQGAAAALVTRIEGSYTNVVGLPVAQVLDALDARVPGGHP